MLRLIARRMAALAVMLVLLSVVVFGLIHLVPGNPEQALLGSRPTTEEIRAAVRERYHLDEPFLAQYWHWITAAVRGDLGTSLTTQESVSAVVASRLSVTISLAVFALTMALAVGIPLGLLAGTRRGQVSDRAVSLFAAIALSAPTFVVGIGLIYLVSIRLGALPAYGAGEGFADRLVHLILPAMTIAAGQVAVIVRQMRATTAGAVGAEYTRFARARGVSRPRIWIGYVLRNASLPVVTGAGLLLASAFGGSIVVEHIFGLPGVGAMLLRSVQAKDIPMVQGMTLSVTVLVVVAMLAVDVLMLLVDPRLRYRRSQA